MPKTQSNLLELVNSDSDDEFASQLGIRTTAVKATTAKATSGKMPAAKKTARGGAAAKTAKTAAAANKVTKPAAKKTASGRRTSGRLAAAIEDSVEGRAALSEKSTNQEPPPKATKGRKPAATKDVEMVDEPVVATPPPAKTRGGRGRPKKTVTEEEEIPESQPEPAKPAPARRSRKPAASKPRAEIEIPETQQQEPEQYPDEEPTTMDLDLTLDPALEDLPNSPAPAPVPPSASRKAAPPYSATRRPLSATSFSTTDDSVALRRRIGELTKQYTALETRYRDLRDIAARDAEINFDRLRKQTDEQAAAASALVDSLKSELAVQKELAREGAKHKTQLDLSEARVDSLQKTVIELTTSLSESKAENKNLSVKLVAARGTEAAKAAAVPSSAVKKGVSKANGDGIHAATVMQMKEDLYGDLTGLIVRGVKNVAGEDVFDCLQTGRNGSKSLTLLSLFPSPLNRHFYPCARNGANRRGHSTTLQARHQQRYHLGGLR